MSDGAAPLASTRPDAHAALLAGDSLRAVVGDTQLLAFLATQRWFGGKGRTARTARVASAVPVAHEDGRWAIALVDVDFADAATDRYQLPLAARRAVELPAGASTSVVAIAELDGEAVSLFDAVHDPAFRTALGQWLARGATFEGDGARWSAEALGDLAPDSLASARLAAAEQSNTSIVFGDAAILKLFRRLEPGEHPDVELTRFLTHHAAFPHTPALLSTIHVERAGERSVAGMLQRFLPASTDAWSYALALAREYLGAPAGEREPPNPFARDAATLGAITRALHEALARDTAEEGFGARPATAAEVRAWAADARGQIAAGFRDLDAQLRVGTLPPAWIEPARALLRRNAAADRRVVELVDAIDDDAGSQIRHHGDYHLGQVLRTREAEFMIIDFEGEPARSLAVRRRHHSPLRDVAGMLRSFGYAAAAAVMAVGGSHGAPTVDAAREVRAARWERDARRNFLDGYLRGAGPGTFLPRRADAATSLLALFEIEKLFYELSYEVNNRPDWVWIPLRGIAKLF